MSKGLWLTTISLKGMTRSESGEGGDVSTIGDGRVNVPPDPLDFGMTSGELVVPGNGDHE